MQSARTDLVPVILVDTPVLHVFRRAGYVVELAPPQRFGEALVEARITAVPDLVLVLADADAPESAARLREALLAQGSAPRRSRRRRAARRLLSRL
ncbi:hypothetical protein WDV85_02575 [Pseudokineococcus sp. 5B2Z-1]|uniref:hypothetical protein n=1 Tax=Pseudokineococcus sp. 5B2Z-1 TaxID=3132744 RepID=UPI003094DADB